MEFNFEPIGIVRSCFPEKFGIPRQPRLVTAAQSRLELLPKFARDEAFAGLEDFSHLWLIFVFHDCLGARPKPTVRPPRLGRQRKVGVFASRAPYRPNPIGISAVENLGTERTRETLCVKLGGVDLLDGFGAQVLSVEPTTRDTVPERSCLTASRMPSDRFV